MDYDYVRRRVPQDEENLMLISSNPASDRYPRYPQDGYQRASNLPATDSRINRNAPPAPIISSQSRTDHRGYDQLPPSQRYGTEGSSSNSNQVYDPAHPLDIQPVPPPLFKSQRQVPLTRDDLTPESQSNLERPPRFNPYAGELKSNRRIDWQLREEMSLPDYFVDTSLETRREIRASCNDGKGQTVSQEVFTRRLSTNPSLDSWRGHSENISQQEKRFDSRDDALDRFLESNQSKQRPPVWEPSEFVRPFRTSGDTFDVSRGRDRGSESYYSGRLAVAPTENFGETYTKQARAAELIEELSQAKEIDWQLPTSRKSSDDLKEVYNQAASYTSNLHQSLGGSNNVAEQSGSVTTFRRKVTHVDGQIGFAGTDLFFQLSKVVGPVKPQLGNWVIAKAEKVQSMPFDWNALTVEVEPVPIENSDLRTRHYQSGDQIPLILPSAQNTFTVEGTGNRPLKSILKNKPPPPPQISAPRIAPPLQRELRPDLGPRSLWNRSPSPESPLIVFENIIPERRRKVSPGRKSKDRDSVERERKRSRHESKSPRRSPRPSARSPRRVSKRSSRSSSPRRSPRLLSRSPRRSPQHLSRSPRRSPQRLSRSPRRSPRRFSRSPRRSSRRISKSPRRSPRRRSRSFSRSPVRISRSPRRSPRRLSSSPRRSPRRISRSPRRSPRRRSRSFSMSPRRISRSPIRSAKKESPVSAKKKRKNDKAQPISLPQPEPKKPVPVSFTWVKSAKDPTQPQAKNVPPTKKKHKPVEQLPAYRLVENAMEDIKKQKEASTAAALKKTAETIKSVKENLLQAKKSQGSKDTVASNLTKIPLLSIPNQPAFQPNQPTFQPNQSTFQPSPNYPPTFPQPQGYFPGPSYPPAPFPSQPFILNPQFQHSGYPDQYQTQPQPHMYGDFATGQMSYQQQQVPFHPQQQVPHHQQQQVLHHQQQQVPRHQQQQASRHQQQKHQPSQPAALMSIHPPGENPPSQIKRTTFGLNADKSQSKGEHSGKKNNVVVERGPVMVKNPFHKGSPQEPLPPGVDSNDDNKSMKSTAGEKLTPKEQNNPGRGKKFPSTNDDPPPPGTTQEPEQIHLDDLSDDEICTIYVKPASALFEDVSESESIPTSVSAASNKKASSVAEKSPISIAPEALEPISDVNTDVEIMDSKEAIQLGCRPDKASQARRWMICIRCAKRGHLIEMCDKERMPRALPFEISMAKALLKDSRKQQTGSSTPSATVEKESASKTEDSSKNRETSNSSSRRTSPKKAVTDKIAVWEEERQRLKQNSGDTESSEKNPSSTSPPAYSADKVTDSEDSGKKSVPGSGDKGHPAKKADSANTVALKDNKVVAKSKPVGEALSSKDSKEKSPSGKTSSKQVLPKKSAQARQKVQPKKTNLPAAKTQDQGSKSNPGGNKPAVSKAASKSIAKLSSKLTQRRKELLAQREQLDKPKVKGKAKDSSHGARSNDRHSTSRGRDSGDDVVRISRRRSLSPRDREPPRVVSPRDWEPPRVVSPRDWEPPRVMSPRDRDYPRPVSHQVFNDPMRAVQVKQLELKSLELRDLELQQQMKLLMAEQQRMDISRHPHGETQRPHDHNFDRGAYPSSSRMNHFCYVCLGTDHRARDCLESCPSWVRNKVRVPEGFVIEKSRGLLEPFCLSCGKVGHFTRQCRFRNNFGEYSDDD